MAIKTQDELIGLHPTDGGIFEVWTKSTDITPTAKLKHRVLEIDDSKRTEAIEEISDWIIKHHIPEHKLKEIAVKKRILDQYGFTGYLKNIDILPSLHTTVVGNSTEVIMSEYINNISSLEMLVYRLHFNTNVNQSMKGDDTLFLNKEDLASKIIVGESKYRKVSAKKMVTDITDTLGNSSRKPLSLTFTQYRLHERGEKKLAKKVSELQAKLSISKTELVDVGFIISDEKTTERVQADGESQNSNLVFVTICLNDPQTFIYDCFKRANEKLEEIDQISLLQTPKVHAKDVFMFEAKKILSQIKDITG